MNKTNSESIQENIKIIDCKIQRSRIDFKQHLEQINKLLKLLKQRIK